jgi:hypothetical protein
MISRFHSTAFDNRDCLLPMPQFHAPDFKKIRYLFTRGYFHSLDFKEAGHFAEDCGMQASYRYDQLVLFSRLQRGPFSSNERTVAFFRLQKGCYRFTMGRFHSPDFKEIAY